MIDLNAAAPILQGLSDLAVLLGVPWAIYLYFRDTKRHSLERQLDVYKETDNNFILLQQMFLANPELPVSIYHKDVEPASLTEDQIQRSFIACDVIASMLERVFVLFREAPPEIRDRQWPGWQTYTALQCENKVFAKWWCAGDYGYDPEFSDFLNGIIRPEDAQRTGSVVNATPQALGVVNI